MAAVGNGPEVLAKFDDGGGLVTVILNRAAKLNALNLNMIRLLHKAVDDVDRRAGKLSCLIMEGDGGKAFCAGGDVASIRSESLAGGTLPADFFYEEYAVVFRLASMLERTGCCHLSLWDGITMGGGVGLSAHGQFRIVTEKTRFAKPEMAIGLFPDVGSTHLLSRIKLGPSVGLFLGITGSTLGAWDCMRCGLATHYLPSSSIPKLRSLLMRKCTAGVVGAAAVSACNEALRQCAEEAGKDAELGAPPKAAIFTDENVEIINQCFGAPTLEEIVARLQAHPSQFAAAALKTMYASCSPTSCKVTMRAMREFAPADVKLAHALMIEYRLSQRFTLRPQPLSDFYEGIRAVLVDKDRKQKWSPGWDELGRITDQAVDEFFAPLEAGHRRGELKFESLHAWTEGSRPPFPTVISKAKL
eukprot:TRINITY_DN38358_c0_g1_i1.p1 TRINITY_DN38358_c0_g1~~TRINITY_DN38358_c0_g1_i1.p1  ORF type:complete len:435 (+),score=84.90 TRINITY_DN38358_c0_g1_i1:58-1305(+)